MVDMMVLRDSNAKYTEFDKRDTHNEPVAAEADAADAEAVWLKRGVFGIDGLDVASAAVFDAEKIRMSMESLKAEGNSEAKR